MKAIGYLENLSIEQPASLLALELPQPTPGPSDLIVQIRAISINPVDVKIRRTGPIEGGVPTILGWDASGVVLQRGDEVQGFEIGDEVFYAGSVAEDGANSEFHRVDARLVAKKPKTLSFAQAAALPLTAITAYEALFERLGINPNGSNVGKSLLVLGGAGGVGSIAIQLARLAGLQVIATASRPESSAWCMEMGADHVLNHSKPMLPQLQLLGMQGVDFILNTADTEGYWDFMAEATLPLGRICAIVETSRSLNVDLLKTKSISFSWEFIFTRSLFQTADMGKQGEILKQIAAWIDSGKLRTTLKEYLSPIGVETLKQAHAQVESGKSIGKFVLENWE